MIDRRQFGKGAAGLFAAGLFSINSERSGSRILGANEELRVAVIGIRGRGGSLIDSLNKSKGARVVALCDVDREVLAKKDAKNTTLYRTTDFRELLERNDVDAIASATPNHWHALLTILACQAGKHVYIEKPISHNMAESEAIVAAARKYERIVQAGFQNRSDEALRPFFEDLKAGVYGRVLRVHGTCHRQRDSIGKLEAPLVVPKHIDYNLWLGPAEDQPLLRPGLHYDWHWDFNTGNGDVGNQGPHEWDMIQWALGDPAVLPTSMQAAGNRFAWDDAGNTPNVMACSGESNGVPILFEVMDLKGGRAAPRNNGVGVVVTTDKGTFSGGRGGGSFVHDDGTKVEFRTTREGKKPASREVLHMQNFVDAVKANDRTLLRSECEVAARSSSMAHMANIAFQLGKKASPTDVETAFSGSVPARDMVARLRESVLLHGMTKGLTEVSEPWILGPNLSLDPATARFVSEHKDAANARRERTYRKGFELPTL